MSVKWIADVLEHDTYQQVDGTELLVLIILADHSNSEGIAWPSIDRMARMARRSKRTVLECLGALETAGYVDRHRRFNEDGKQITTLYRLLPPDQIDNPQPVDNRGAVDRTPTGEGANPRTGEGAKSAGLGVRSTAPKPKENRHIEPSPATPEAPVEKSAMGTLQIPAGTPPGTSATRKGRTGAIEHIQATADDAGDPLAGIEAARAALHPNESETT